MRQTLNQFFQQIQQARYSLDAGVSAQNRKLLYNAVFLDNFVRSSKYKAALAQLLEIVELGEINDPASPVQLISGPAEIDQKYYLSAEPQAQAPAPAPAPAEPQAQAPAPALAEPQAQAEDAAKAETQEPKARRRKRRQQTALERLFQRNDELFDDAVVMASQEPCSKCQALALAAADRSALLGNESVLCYFICANGHQETRMLAAEIVQSWAEIAVKDITESADVSSLWRSARHPVSVYRVPVMWRSKDPLYQVPVSDYICDSCGADLEALEINPDKAWSITYVCKKCGHSNAVEMSAAERSEFLRSAGINEAEPAARAAAPQVKPAAPQSEARAAAPQAEPAARAAAPQAEPAAVETCAETIFSPGDAENEMLEQVKSWTTEKLIQTFEEICHDKFLHSATPQQTEEKARRELPLRIVQALFDTKATAELF